MKTILTPIDYSDATGSVLEASSMLARAFKAKIVLIHVIRPTVVANAFCPEVADLQVKEEIQDSKQLAYWRQELLNDGLAVDANEAYGDPARCIQDEARRIGADVIVVGSHGHGAMYDILVGSTTAGLLRKAPCPVLVVPVSGLKSPSAVTTAEPGVEAEDAARVRRQVEPGRVFMLESHGSH